MLCTYDIVKHMSRAKLPLKPIGIYYTLDLNSPPINWGLIHRKSWQANQPNIWLQDFAASTHAIDSIFAPITQFTH
jgi:hypothetical protein